MVYDDSWYKYSSGFFKELETRSKLGNIIYFFGKQIIIGILKDNCVKLELPTVVFGDKEDVIINYGKDVAKLKDEILKSTINSYNKVSGSVASRGMAIGKVRLIEPHVENQKFEEGEILVTRMTTPDLMPLIKKASAIITDEGGITCHAAIVSREFKKPCIIGTKIATQIFKDGDIIEVDAEIGVINRVK